MTDPQPSENPPARSALRNRESLALDYETQVTSAARHVETLEPETSLALAAPAIYCWLAWLLFQFEQPLGSLDPSGLEVTIGAFALCLWPVAFACALASLISYSCRPKPWHVWLNLIVNISGLLFTGWFWGRIFWA